MILKLQSKDAIRLTRSYKCYNLEGGNINRYTVSRVPYLAELHIASNPTMGRGGEAREIEVWV